MKIERKFQDFIIRRNNGKIFFHFGKGWPDNGFVIALYLWGLPGNKHWLTGQGRAVYFAFNSGSLRWRDMHRGGRDISGKLDSWFTRLTKIEFGITFNGNSIPWMSH